VKLVVSLVALAAGCGRVAFDATADGGSVDGSAGDSSAACVPVGHDDDGDSVDDACDLCPQRADDGLDSDGDGVGDDCDVSSLGQMRVLFDPFTAQRTDWSLVTGTYTGDEIRFENLTTSGGAALVAAPGRETFELTGDLVMGNATGAQVSISIGEIEPAPAHYYCEIYDDGTVASLQLTYTFDNVGYTQVDTAAFAARFDSGPFRIVFEHTPPTFRCWAEHGGERVEVGGSLPAGIPLDQVGFGVSRVRADMQSFVRLANP